MGAKKQLLKSSSKSLNGGSNPKVSIIIPTKNKATYLRGCQEAIEKNTPPIHELIIVNNNSYEEDALALLKEYQNRPNFKLLHYPYKFNFSKINNMAAEHASGEFLLFLNNDTVPQKGWLDALLEVAQRKDLGNVGIVGAKLLYPNGTIQSAGNNIKFVDGEIKFVHNYVGMPSNLKEANKVRECDGVSGACLLVKKDLFNKVKGFEKEYWIEQQEDDLCLKVKKIGYKVIYTPEAIVYHNVLTTRGKIRKVVIAHDDEIFRKKWFSDYLIKKTDSKKDDKKVRILAIKLMTLGDVILCTPILEALRKKYPEAYIAFATSEKYAELVEGNPYVDFVYKCRDYDSKINALNHYDSITSDLMKRQMWSEVYQLQLHDTLDLYWSGEHLLDLYADIADVKVNREKLHISISKEDKKFAKTEISRLKNRYKNKRVIAIHTTAGWEQKNWDFKKYDELVKRLSKNYTFIQVGGKEDYKAKEVKDFRGLSIRKTAALIKECDLFIGPDSGPMHIAATVNVPVIGLFGCTAPYTAGPIADNYVCIISDAVEKSPIIATAGRSKVEKIRVEQVKEAINKMLDRKEKVQETWWKGNVYPKLGKELFNPLELPKMELGKNLKKFEFEGEVLSDFDNIGRLMDELEAKDKSISGLQKNVENLNNQINHLKSQLEYFINVSDMYNTEIRNLRRDLVKIKSSRLWKIGTFVHKVKKGLRVNAY